MIKYNSSMITIAFQQFSLCLFVRDDQLEVSLNLLESSYFIWDVYVQDYHPCRMLFSKQISILNNKSNHPCLC